MPLLSTIHYGNDATAEVYYQSAALLIEVPVFTRLEQVNEEIELSKKKFEKFIELLGKIERRLNNEIEELEADIVDELEDVSECNSHDRDLQKLKDKRQKLEQQVYSKRNELTQLKSCGLTKDRHLN